MLFCNYMHLYCLIVTLKIQLNLRICNVRWCVITLFDNNPTHCVVILLEWAR